MYSPHFIDQKGCHTYQEIIEVYHKTGFKKIAISGEIRSHDLRPCHIYIQLTVIDKVIHFDYQHTWAKSGNALQLPLLLVDLLGPDRPTFFI